MIGLALNDGSSDVGSRVVRPTKFSTEQHISDSDLPITRALVPTLSSGAAVVLEWAA